MGEVFKDERDYLISRIQEVNEHARQANAPFYERLAEIDALEPKTYWMPLEALSKNPPSCIKEVIEKVEREVQKAFRTDLLEKDK